MNKKRRYNDLELSLIKSTYSENEVLLKTIRKAMYKGNDLTDNDIKLLSDTFKTDESKKLLSKTFSPEMEIDAPILQCFNLWTVVDLKNKPIHELGHEIKVRYELIKKINTGLSNVFNPTTAVNLIELDLDEENIELDETVIKILVTQQYTAHVESMLNQLIVLAGEKKESVEETLARLDKSQTR